MHDRVMCIQASAHSHTLWDCLSMLTQVSRFQSASYTLPFCSTGPQDTWLKTQRKFHLGFFSLSNHPALLPRPPRVRSFSKFCSDRHLLFKTFREFLPVQEPDKNHPSVSVFFFPERNKYRQGINREQTDMAITERLGTLRALYNLHYLNNMTFSQLVISTRFDAMAT